MLLHVPFGYKFPVLLLFHFPLVFPGKDGYEHYYTHLEYNIRKFLIKCWLVKLLSLNTLIQYTENYAYRKYKSD